MKNIGILLFNHIDVLDFAGPFEVFTTTNRLFEWDKKPQPFNVYTFSEM